jgi:hypothetical protein
MPNWNPRPERPFDYAAAQLYASTCTTGARELSAVANRRAAVLATARDDWSGGHRRTSDEQESQLARAWGDLTSAVLREAARTNNAIDEARAYDRARAAEQAQWESEAAAEREEAQRRLHDPATYFPALEPVASS